MPIARCNRGAKPWSFPGVKQVLEPTDPQILFAQLAMKALDVRIRRRFAGLDMHQLDFLLNYTRPGSDDWSVPGHYRSESNADIRAAR